MALYRKPFRQVVTDVMAEMREPSTQTAVVNKFKRRINDIYTSDLPARYEFPFLEKKATVTLVANYTTGTVAVGVAGTTVTGTDTVWSTYSATSNLKIKFNSNDEVYDFTYVGSTSGTIDPAYTGSSALTEDSYVLFVDTYALAADFGRPTNVPGFFCRASGVPVKSMSWVGDTVWHDNYTVTGADYPMYWRISPTRTSLGLSQVEISPPVSAKRLLSYEYIKALPMLTSYDGATDACTTTAASATVTIASTDVTAEATAGRYFRVDADGPSDWRKISSSAYSTNTTITLDSVYRAANAAVTTGFTISDVPDLPVEAQNILLYGACWKTAYDQNDPAQKSLLQAYLDSIDKAMAVKARQRYGSKTVQVMNYYR